MMMPSWCRSRWVKVVSALLLLAALYFAADWRSVGRVLTTLDPRYFAAALALFLPQTLLSAWRWRTLATSIAPIRYTEALRHTAIASAWNLIVPSKLGDLSKAALLPDLKAKQRAAAGGVVVAEKIADVAALCALILLGVAGEQLKGGVVLLGLAAMGGGLSERLTRTLYNVRLAPALMFKLGAASLLLWCFHLWQIELFMQAAGVAVPWQLAAARLPIAIFAGLLPVSFCGIGTRDAALV